MKQNQNDRRFALACPHGVDAPASSPQVLILFHEIDQQVYGVGLEVDVPVQGEQVRVLGDHLFALHRDG